MQSTISLLDEEDLPEFLPKPPPPRFSEEASDTNNNVELVDLVRTNFCVNLQEKQYRLPSGLRVDGGGGRDPFSASASASDLLPPSPSGNHPPFLGR